MVPWPLTAAQHRAMWLVGSWWPSVRQAATPRPLQPGDLHHAILTMLGMRVFMAVQETHAHRQTHTGRCCCWFVYPQHVLLLPAFLFFFFFWPADVSLLLFLDLSFLP